MIIKRIVTIIAVLLAVVTSATVGTAAAEPELPPCQANPQRSDVVLEFSEGEWAYLYRLIWCVEENRITWAVPDVVPVLPDSSDCSWMGMFEESLEPTPGGESWLGFAMGRFSCPNGAEAPDDYPWGIIHVRPAGTSAIQAQGTA